MTKPKTFYESIQDGWKNNKTIAIVVFLIAGIVAIINSYETIDNFVRKVFDNSSEIAFFNQNVQPIYFEGRGFKLIGDNCTPIEKLADSIQSIQPKSVIIKSHTSKVNLGPNLTVTFRRGTLIGTELRARLVGRYKGSIFLVSYGGAETTKAESDYQERVEVILSNDVDSLKAYELPANAVAIKKDLIPSPKQDYVSSCLITAG